jgi:hypothetical protein
LARDWAMLPPMYQALLAHSGLTKTASSAGAPAAWAPVMLAQASAISAASLLEVFISMFFFI